MITWLKALWCRLAHGSSAAHGAIDGATGYGRWHCMVCHRAWETWERKS